MAIDRKTYRTLVAFLAFVTFMGWIHTLSWYVHLEKNTDKERTFLATVTKEIQGEIGKRFMEFMTERMEVRKEKLTHACKMKYGMGVLHALLFSIFKTVKKL